VGVGVTRARQGRVGLLVGSQALGAEAKGEGSGVGFDREIQEQDSWRGLQVPRHTDTPLPGLHGVGSQVVFVTKVQGAFRLSPNILSPQQGHVRVLRGRDSAESSPIVPSIPALWALS
jgi:hypothetical protein